MANFLVTGGAGFIGSNLSYELVKQGNTVCGLDNLSTGTIDNVKSERFAGLPGKFSFVEKDINDEDLAQCFDGFDYVLHLAALARVSFSVDHPIEANHANIDGTLNVLEAARKAGTKRVVFSSSSSVYGGATVFPTPETDKPNPLSPYALHKLAGEYYMKLYSKLYQGIDTVCLRYFNVCGEGQRTGKTVAYSTVVPAFMDRCFNGGTCLINGDGTVSRDFCYVGNVVQANILAAQYPNKLNGECFNIACGETHSVNEVYDKICELSGKTLPKVNGPVRLGDPHKSEADITKARSILGYEPKVKFAEAMELTYNWWWEECK